MTLLIPRGSIILPNIPKTTMELRLVGKSTKEDMPPIIMKTVKQNYYELYHDALNSVHSGTFFGKYCMNIWPLHELFDDILMLQDGGKFLSIFCRLMIFDL